MDSLGSEYHHIGGLGSPHHAERILGALAAKQHGVVARRQLVERGFTVRAIERRLEQGRLHRIHRGIYAVGHSLLTQRGRWAAAVLACGPDALLSHLDAAAVWDLARPYGSINVTTTARGRHGHPGITLHRVRHLHPDDCARRNGFPVTSVARTLLDLAATLNRTRLERILERAERLELLDVIALDALLARRSGRRGCPALRAVLAAYLPSAAETRSGIERRFLALCRDAKLPRPKVNVIVEGFEVDMAWPEHRLVVELDSFGFHGTHGAFERDRIRDAALKLAGWDSIRITERRLKCEPQAVAAILRGLLA
jgi:very-short-patch-repair endonuclease